MNDSREEVFDWAVHEPQPASAELVPRPDAPLVPVHALDVVVDPQGRGQYVQRVEPVPVQPFDPWPQRLLGCGVALSGGGIFAVGAGAGTWLACQGLAVAERAVVALAVAGGTLGLVALATILTLRYASGVRIGRMDVGDNANVQIGSGR